MLILDFDHYKRTLDLVALAERYGYQRLKAKSSVRQVVLEHPDSQDRVVVMRAQPHAWYFNPRDDRDKGTVIDFLLNREAGDWVRVKAVLAGAGQMPPPPQWAPPPVRPLPDFLAQCQPLHDRRYLYARGLSDTTLDHPAFGGRIFNQGDKVAFPLYQGQRWVGLDLKGPHFKGYAPGSRKSEGCWYSDPAQCRPQEGCFVICESALDGLSYHQLFPSDAQLVLSLGGLPSQGQLHVLQLLCDSLAPQQVRLACDADAAGQRLNLQLALTLQAPRAVPSDLESLLEAIGPRRSRLSLSLGPAMALQREALPLLLGGLSAHPLEVVGPTEAESQWLWSLTFVHEPQLLQALTRLVLTLRGLNDWLTLAVPAAKDWNALLMPGRNQGR